MCYLLQNKNLVFYLASRLDCVRETELNTGHRLSIEPWLAVRRQHSLVLQKKSTLQKYFDYVNKFYLKNKNKKNPLWLGNKHDEVAWLHSDIQSLNVLS